MLDRIDALPQLVEHAHAAFEQRAAVNCRLRAMCGTIEEPNPKCMFEFCDCLRDSRLREIEVRGCLGHAAPFGHRQQQAEVT